MRSWMPGEAGWTEHGPRKVHSADEPWATGLSRETRQAMRAYGYDAFDANRDHPNRWVRRGALGSTS